MRRYRAQTILTGFSCLVLAVFVAACGPAASGPGPDDIAIMCTGPLAAPGTTPAAASGSGSCASSLGPALTHLSCADATDLAHLSGVQLGELNTKTNSRTDNRVTVTLHDGRCGFSVPQGYMGYLRTASSVHDGIAIVDFVPISGESGAGLLMRCPDEKPDCVGLWMFSKEVYRCVEKTSTTPTTLTEGTFAGQQFPAPQLQINKPNRLVLLLRGDIAEGYINGRQICHAHTRVDSSSFLEVAVLAGGTAVARVDILDVYVFASD
jgi:hypothetical protein